jgi:hypothetical protein
VDEPSDIDQELTLLESEIKKLEAQYNMFFAGRLPRPPWESRKRVEILVRRLDRLHIANYGQRFKFTTLQSRFSTSIDLWDRGLRAREEGRPGPFSQPMPVAEKPKPRQQGDHVVHVTTLRDPSKEPDKLRELYDNLAEARREVGQDAISFQKFADLIKTQMTTLKEKGNREVSFRVAVKDGKVAVTARGIKGKGEK